jgi:hypothetical protein
MNTIGASQTKPTTRVYVIHIPGTPCRFEWVGKLYFSYEDFAHQFTGLCTLVYSLSVFILLHYILCRP